MAYSPSFYYYYYYYYYYKFLDKHGRPAGIICSWTKVTEYIIIIIIILALCC
jgi:hypothetical protein